MLRFLALTAVLFVIPFAIYSGWILATHRRMPEQADFPTGRTIAFSVVGAVLVLIGLIWLALSEGSIAPDGAPLASILGNLAG
jgi:hypothetical protein